MARNLLDFHFNSFGIDHPLIPCYSDDSVAFQTLTIVWNLNRWYKTKVITSLPKRSTLTSNEGKKMSLSMETSYSIKTCSSRLKVLFFVKIYVFG